MSRSSVGSVVPGSGPRRKRWGIWLFFLILLELLALAGIGAIASYELRYADRVNEGVQVAGIPLGGLSLEATQRLIETELTPYPGPPVTLRYGDRTWLLSRADLGVSVDAMATAAEAYAVGRRDFPGAPPWTELLADLFTQWGALSIGYNIAPVLKYDDTPLVIALRDIAREMDLPPQEATLTITGLDVSSTPGQPGRQVNVEATHAVLAKLARAGTGGTVDLIVEERPPSVRSTEAAATRARTLLSEPLLLVADTLDGVQRFGVDRPTLRSWLQLSTSPSADGTVTLSAALDRDQVTAFFQQIAEQVDRPAYDAALDFDPESNEVVVLKPSTQGQKLEVDAAVAAVESAVMGDQREITPQAGTPSGVKVPVTILKPKVDSDKIGEMGIVEKVSEGTTNFKGSSADRVHNIANAAQKFQGVVIPPGEEFSFNRYVGDITTANGFVEGLVIGAERTAVGIGGGVCQVSTTVFRAAFWGGFPIVERYAHGYVVSWYEPPRGLDATIYTPSVDFRFRNDTEHYLLVKPEVDTAEGRLTFYLYGTKVDRTVEMEGPVEKNLTKPGPPIYEEDDSLAEGVINRVDWAKDGMDVYITRRILYGDGRVVAEEFVSKYRPWREVYKYGPGTAVPDASGASDEGG